MPFRFRWEAARPLAKPLPRVQVMEGPTPSDLSKQPLSGQALKTPRLGGIWVQLKMETRMIGLFLRDLHHGYSPGRALQL